MKIVRMMTAVAALFVFANTSLHAETTLRIGLAEDPDILDPSIARTYVGRHVFGPGRHAAHAR